MHVGSQVTQALQRVNLRTMIINARIDVCQSVVVQSAPRMIRTCCQAANQMEEMQSTSNGFQCACGGCRQGEGVWLDPLARRCPFRECGLHQDTVGGQGLSLSGLR